MKTGDIWSVKKKTDIFLDNVKDDNYRDIAYDRTSKKDNTGRTAAEIALDNHIDQLFTISGNVRGMMELIEEIVDYQNGIKDRFIDGLMLISRQAYRLSDNERSELDKNIALARSQANSSKYIADKEVSDPFVRVVSDKSIIDYYNNLSDEEINKFLKRYGEVPTKK